MLIHSVYIEHFRSIKNETLSCDPLTVLVGPNGAGKSTFLQALRIFYDVNARLGSDDFFANDTTKPILIRIAYGALRPDEQEEFKAYLQGDTLGVTKRITCTDGRIEQRYYAATMQLPAFAEIRSLRTKTEQLERWNQLVETGTLSGIAKAKKGQDLVALMSAYETANQNLLAPVEKEEQFFGPRNIGGGKLDNFTKFVYLPAVRDVTDDTADSKAGTLSQLLETLVMRKLHSRPDVQAFKTEFSERLKNIYDPKNVAELTTLGDAISATLREFVPGAAFHVEFGEVKVPDIPTPPAIPRVTEDDFAGDITRKGHGLQRALIFTLLQHLAVLRRGEDASSAPPGTEPAHATDAKAEGPDLILAIEEPELYQHPQRCRYLADLLFQLSQDPTRGLGARNQVIYTTHSSYFVSLDRFAHVRLTRKIKDSPAQPPHTTLAAYSLADAAQQLAQITQGKPEDFTAERFRVRAYPIMTPIVAEGFFANAVVVVEGMTEAAALWKLAELLDKQWSRKGIVVIPAGGKDSIDKPVVIFRGLKIPTYFAFDGDARHKGKQQEDETAQKNQRCLRMAGAAAIVPFPLTSVNDTWACFEDHFETCCEGELGGDVFAAHRDSVAKKFGYDQPAEALKNFDVAAAFVERLYADGKRLPTLEDIVNRITALA